MKETPRGLELVTERLDFNCYTRRYAVSRYFSDDKTLASQETKHAAIPRPLGGRTSNPSWVLRAAGADIRILVAALESFQVRSPPSFD